MITNNKRSVQSVRSSNLIGEFDNKEIREYNLGEKLLYVLVEKGWENLLVVPVIQEWRIDSADKSLVGRDLLSETYEFISSLVPMDWLDKDSKLLYKLTGIVLQTMKEGLVATKMLLDYYPIDVDMFVDEFNSGTLAELYDNGVPAKVLLRRYKTDS